MKKIKKFLPLLMTACILGGVGVSAVDTFSASAAPSKVETTLKVQSGYKSGFFANVSSYKDAESGEVTKKGVSIEFDLYDTNFKELDYNKDFDVMQSNGTYGSLAAVSFTFFRKESNYPATNPDHIPVPAWHTYDLSEHNFGGFQYFCNGQIKEWHDIGNAVQITDYIGYPSQFMEEGYSYKVMVRYDRFEFEGSTYNADGKAWFCVERKGLFESEENYEILFAYQKRQTADYYNGTLSGMDIQGLAINADGNPQFPTSATGNGQSLVMEVDNVRIYDGMDFDAEGITKSWEDFEDVKEESIKISEEIPADGGGKTVTFNGKNYLEFANGIREISTNFGKSIGFGESVTCRLTKTKRELYPIEFYDEKDLGENGQPIEGAIPVDTRQTFEGFDFSSTRIYTADKQQVYQFNYQGVDFSDVTAGYKIFGKPVSYFTMSIYSGVGTIKDKVMRVGVSDKVLLNEGMFVREGYELVGFSLKEGDDNVQYEVGDVVDMKCQDMTLYAVWKLPEYKTVYKRGNLTIGEVITTPGKTPFYQGSTPEKAGYVFSGWSKTAEEAQNQTISANFIMLSDVNAENRAVSVENSISFKREGYASVALVDICFDLLALPENAKIVVLGEDITEYLEAGYKIRITVSKQGNMSVSQAYIGTDFYKELYTKEKVADNNATVEFSFENGVKFDTLTMSYDNKNAYTQTFEGVESISEGIYDNYYTVIGEATTIPFAKDKVVTFQDTNGRVVAKTYTYQGGNVRLLNKIDGITHAIEWDKEQVDLHNIQEDITVTAALDWPNCSVNFVVTQIYGFMNADGVSVDPLQGDYGSKKALPIGHDYCYGDYEIIGWTDVENGGFAKYTGEFTFKDEQCTLYSVWGRKTITVTFKLTEDGEALETQTVESNSTVRFNGEIPEKPGYKFVGWDKDTYGVTEDTVFIAQYEEIVKKVHVSVLGGTGAGHYDEYSTVTIAFREIPGIVFADWKIVSGDATIENNNGVYTLVLGSEDVVVEAVRASDGETNGQTSAQSNGCTATVSTGIVMVALICGCAYVALKKKGEE